MLNKKKQQILKHNLKNNIALKYEYKNLILKSIIHNRNLNLKIRLISKYYINSSHIKKNKKICFLSGKHKAVNTKFNMSRHNINYLSKLGILQNFKLKSW